MIQCWSEKKNITKKVENGWKKVARSAFGCPQHPKAGWNTQQIGKFGWGEITSGSALWRRVWLLSFESITRFMVVHQSGYLSLGIKLPLENFNENSLWSSHFD